MRPWMRILDCTVALLRTQVAGHSTLSKSQSETSLVSYPLYLILVGCILFVFFFCSCSGLRVGSREREGEGGGAGGAGMRGRGSA